MSKDLISFLYSALLDLSLSDPPSFTISWHRDIVHDLSPRQWSCVWASLAIKLNAINVKGQAYKMTAHWYMTPTKFGVPPNNRDPFCWRGCRAISSYYHSWWSCPVVTSFWDQFHVSIIAIMGYLIPKGPKLMLLNLWGPNTVLPVLLGSDWIFMLSCLYRYSCYLEKVHSYSPGELVQNGLGYNDHGGKNGQTYSCRLWWLYFHVCVSLVSGYFIPSSEWRGISLFLSRWYLVTIIRYGFFTWFFSQLSQSAVYNRLLCEVHC